MKGGIAAFLTLTLALVVCFTLTGTRGASAEVTFQEHSVELGTEVSYIKYEEPDIMDETGVMYGIVGSYAYHNGIMLKVDGKGSYGQVDYDGRLNNGTPYTVSSINDYMLEFRGLGGYDISISETVVITPYFGFGYRYLNDDLGKDSLGYEREANYYYSPIGIEAITELQNGWSVGATAEYDYFWKGIQKSHLGDFLAGLDTLENDQEEGFGVRGSIKVQKKGDQFDYLFEPFIRYWDIGESETTAITFAGTPIGLIGFEPKNNSTEIGGKLAVRF